MSKYKIEKGVPMPPRGGVSRKYNYELIPFEDMEVGDSVSVPVNELIIGNTHPDRRETMQLCSCLHSRMARLFTDRKYAYRLDKYVWSVGKKSPPRCMRIWRIK
jgi:hypothetical protein